MFNEKPSETPMRNRLGHLYERRMVWLEIIIVVFFALDLAMMLWFGR